MIEMIIFIFDPVKVYFSYRRHYQRNLFDNSLVTVNSIGLIIGLGEFNDTEVGIQYKPVP